MSKSFKKDLTGQRFGRLTVIGFVPDEKPHASWLCKCDCGNTKIINSKHFHADNTQSCGCLRQETAKTNSQYAAIANSEKRKTHGQSQSRCYRIWRSMKARCLNSKHKHYNLYGGRGITICAEWRNDFQTFYEWAMSNGYSDELTIDRIDYDGNYEPSNCRWVDMQTQQRNKKTNVNVMYNGKVMCLVDAAKFSGISVKTIQARYRKGDRGEHLFRPARRKQK